MLSPVLVGSLNYHIAGFSVAAIGLGSGMLSAIALARYSLVDPVKRISAPPSTQDYVALHRFGFRIAGMMVPLLTIGSIATGYTVYKIGEPFEWTNTRGLFAFSLGLQLFNTPFTLRYLIPLNNAIPQEAEKKDVSNEPKLRQMLEDWHKYHLIRCAYMLTAFALSFHALLF